MNTIMIGAAFALLLLTVHPAYAQEGYGWVLVGQNDHTGAADADRYSRSPLYQADVSYLPGTYSIRQTYTGDTLDGVENAPVTGETAAAKAVFTGIPELILADGPVELDVELSFIERRVANFDIAQGDALARATFCRPQSGPTDGSGGYPEFTDPNGASWFRSGEANGYAAIEETISARIGEGNDKEQRGLCTSLSFGGITMGTTYVYEWRSLSRNSGGVHQRSTEAYDVRKDENGDYIDSGVRVSDITGEVYIRRGDDQLGWEFLNPDDVIYEGDIIFTTGEGSEVIFGLSDMTTFHMRPDSEIIIRTMSEKESKLELLAGKVLTNVKKMIKDGTLEVEMSQAIAGARGTVFVCETDDEISTVKVIEGTVEVQDGQGNDQLIQAGQRIDASQEGLGVASSFDVQSEQREWERRSTNPTVLIGAILIVLLVGGYSYLRTRR